MASINLSDLKQLSGDVRQQLEIRGSFKGYNEFKRALKDVAPDLRRDMDKEIRAILRPVLNDAKSRVPAQPLSGWRLGDGRTGPDGAKMPDWDQATVRKGLVLRQGGRRGRGKSIQTAWKLQNKSGAGVVFELAAKQNSRPGKGFRDSGRVFSNALTLYHGQPSRLLWSAWDAAGGEKKVTREVNAVVKSYEVQLERRLRETKGA